METVLVVMVVAALLVVTAIKTMMRSMVMGFMMMVKMIWVEGKDALFGGQPASHWVPLSIGLGALGPLGHRQGHCQADAH